MLLWSPGVTLEDVERQVILKAHHYYKEVKTTTAAALGISVRTLDTKLEKYKTDEVEEQKRRDAAMRERRDARERHRWGTEARAPGELDAEEQVENENEKRRQQFAKERAEGRRPSIEVAGRAPESATNGTPGGDEANAGVHVEPAPGTPAKPAMSVRERDEVQKVLPAQAAVGGARGRR